MVVRFQLKEVTVALMAVGGKVPEANSSSTSFSLLLTTRKRSAGAVGSRQNLVFVRLSQECENCAMHGAIVSVRRLLS